MEKIKLGRVIARHLLNVRSSQRMIKSLLVYGSITFIVLIYRFASIDVFDSPIYKAWKSAFSNSDSLLDVDNFEFLMNNVSVCIEPTDKTNATMLMMVFSSRYNFPQRDVIRTTWASQKEYRNWRLPLVFLIGIDPQCDPESESERRLWNESRTFGDIIMGNFVDSYRNLTYKHLMG